MRHMTKKNRPTPAPSRMARAAEFGVTITVDADRNRVELINRYGRGALITPDEKGGYTLALDGYEEVEAMHEIDAYPRWFPIRYMAQSYAFSDLITD